MKGKKKEEKGRKGKKRGERGRKGIKGEETERKVKKGEERGRKGKKGEERGNRFTTFLSSIYPPTTGTVHVCTRTDLHHDESTVSFGSRIALRKKQART